MAMVKRFLAVFLVLLTVCAFAAPTLAETGESQQTNGPASEGTPETADAAGAEDETRLIRDDVIDLGKVPEETKMEARCEALLVTDVATGVPVREKNAQVQMPVSGAVLQLMTVVTALDYLEPTDVLTVMREQLKEVPDSQVMLGLKEENEICVSDLVASMLLTGAADAAKMIVDAAVESAGANSIGELMQQKANQLGMTATDYTGCDGIGADVFVMTTAMDQCELYLHALAHPTLSALMKNGTYETQSRYGEAPIAEETEPGTEPEPETEADAKAKSDEPVLLAINKNLPAKIQNRVKAVVPEQKVYDVRLSAAVSWTVKASRSAGSSEAPEKTDAYSVVLFRATTDRSDLVMLYWLPGSGNTVQPKYLVYLTDTFSRSRVVDLIPYVEVATTGLSVEKSGVSVSGWTLVPGHSMFGRVLSGYDPEAYAKVNQETAKNEYEIADMKVLLKPDVGTMVTNEDGSRTMQAKVLVDNSVEGTVTLATAPKVTQTTVSQNTNVLYTEDDVMPEEPTLMSQYGWMIIIGGVVILALIVIIIGIVIRNRMERW